LKNKKLIISKELTPKIQGKKRSLNQICMEVKMNLLEHLEMLLRIKFKVKIKKVRNHKQDNKRKKKWLQRKQQPKQRRHQRSNHTVIVKKKVMIIKKKSKKKMSQKQVYSMI
jgi:hypothetical protein